LQNLTCLTIVSNKLTCLTIVWGCSRRFDRGPRSFDQIWSAKGREIYTSRGDQKVCIQVSIPAGAHTWNTLRSEYNVYIRMCMVHVHAHVQTYIEPITTMGSINIKRPCTLGLQLNTSCLGSNEHVLYRQMSNANSGLQKIMDAQDDKTWSAMEDLPFDDPKWQHKKDLTDTIKQAIKDGGREKKLNKPPSVKDVICCLQWHFSKGPVGVLRLTFEDGRVPATWKLVCHQHDNLTVEIFMHVLYMYRILTLI
jgi:hypothetical protein